MKTIFLLNTELATIRTGLCGEIDSSRVSNLLVCQLHDALASGTLRPSEVISEIAFLEDGKYSNTKNNHLQFKHKPLKGLYKKHFFQASNMPMNMKNYWKPKKNKEHLKKIVEESKHKSVDELCMIIANEVTLKAYEEKSHAREITGEWIIYTKHNNLNYYLGIAGHSDEDEDIYRYISQWNVHEFSFLFPKVQDNNLKEINNLWERYEKLIGDKPYFWRQSNAYKFQSDLESFYKMIKLILNDILF